MTPASCSGRFLDIISLGNVLLDIFDLFQIRGACLELCLTGADSILYDLLLTRQSKTIILHYGVRQAISQFSKVCEAF